MNIRLFGVRAIKCMCAQTKNLGLYSHRKECWRNGVRTHVNSKGKIPSIGKKSPKRRIKPTTLHQAGQQTQNFTTSYSGPYCIHQHTSPLHGSSTKYKKVKKNHSLPNNGVLAGLVFCLPLHTDHLHTARIQGSGNTDLEQYRHNTWGETRKYNST